MGREPVLDIQRLMAAVDGQRRTLGLSWNQVAWQSGIVPSTFTRMLQGGLPGLGTLCRLLRWLGETDLKPYLRPLTATPVSTKDLERRVVATEVVIEAARAWRAMRADTPTKPKPESAALIAAVDALIREENHDG